MAITPDSLSDSQMIEFYDTGRLPMRDLVNRLNPELVFAKAPEPHHEHPMATKLYRKFRAGSAVMTQDEAWDIANELDRLYLLETQTRQRS